MGGGIFVDAKQNVIIKSFDNFRRINGQYQAASLIKEDTNTWLLIGALKA